jgi:vanillate O-demethylase monooxygenase subunit
MDQLTAADILIRNAWYVAGWADDFALNDLRQVNVAGRILVFWRTSEGSVVAFDDRCTHKRMPLSAGRVVDDEAIEWRLSRELLK